MKIHLEIVTPEQPIASEEVDEATIPGIEGEFTILPQHTTLLTQLGTGPLRYRRGSQAKTVQITGGFCEVRQDRVTVLVDQADSLKPGVV